MRLFTTTCHPVIGVGQAALVIAVGEVPTLGTRHV
jgi:hypothetical protein